MVAKAGNLKDESKDHIRRLDFKRIIGFTGNYGSGKTEIAVNYTILCADNKKKTYILDLDIVNPYFRCREARDLMTSLGINVVIPEGDKVHADLPIIVPQIKGTIKREDGNVILDIGGDDIGARVLSHLSGTLLQEELDLLMVLNGNRPFTDQVSGAVKMIHEIEAASSFKITGIVSNTHLINLTTKDTVLDGYKLALDVEAKTRIPIKFVSIEEKILHHFTGAEFSHPIFPIKRMMLPPWDTDMMNKEQFNAKSNNRQRPLQGL
jgi:hypothetical protein